MTLYVNHTGLMWELAEEVGALLVFAEHRFYGKSQPFSEATPQALQLLTSEQALADYAALIFALKRQLGAAQSPVVAFGGSYGGMLAAWLRLHYPGAVDGAVAGSAPIWAFPGEDPEPDAGGFAEVVTFDASAAGGSAPACADNLRAAWAALLAAGKEPSALPRPRSPRPPAASLFFFHSAGTVLTRPPPRPACCELPQTAPRGSPPSSTCARAASSSPATTSSGSPSGSRRAARDTHPERAQRCGDVAAGTDLRAHAAQGAFDYLAMGSYPYASGARRSCSRRDSPSSWNRHFCWNSRLTLRRRPPALVLPLAPDYLTNGDAVLPPFPVRAACEHLADPALKEVTADTPLVAGQPRPLLEALAAAAMVFYNASGELTCVATGVSVNNATADDGTLWDFQACTEMVMPMSRDGVRDAFWPQPWDAAAAVMECKARWGVVPRPEWATVSFGGRRIAYASNIVFSNGGYDPWRYGGVPSDLSRSLVSVFIPDGGHHVRGAACAGNEQEPFLSRQGLGAEPAVVAEPSPRSRFRRWT